MEARARRLAVFGRVPFPDAATQVPKSDASGSGALVALIPATVSGMVSTLAGPARTDERMRFRSGRTLEFILLGLIVAAGIVGLGLFLEWW